ncbi:pigment epithelium-derived factor [Ambystoma mexicanum]|uniref:pigment epithelium-derived factor n=1 Tax=Ambystoma mexicanum TaxID=8296 RepID=UPI0037E742B7
MKLLLVSLCVGLLLSPTNSQDPAGEEEPEGTNPTVTEVEEEDPFYKSPQNRLAAAASNFGYNLYRQQAIKTPSANILMSPLSLASAFSSLSMGAGKKTESVIHRALFYDLLNDPDVHSTYKELIAEITAPQKGFKMASRILLEKRLRLKMDFVNAAEKFYGAKPKVLTGNPRLDLQEANSWIQQQTGGKVTRFLPEIPKTLSILLQGAAYFKGQWASKFNPKETAPRTFHLDEQTSIQVPMMSARSTFVRYGLDSDFNCKIAQLPLTGGVNIMFFLPLTVTQNLTLIEEGLTSEFVHDIDTALQPVNVALTVPRLNLKYEANLADTVQEMKLESLFASPDFSKLSAKALKMTQVQHKTLLELNEDGEEGLPPTPARLGLSLEYHLDHPFIFVLRDSGTGSLLHIGKVMDPRS